MDYIVLPPTSVDRDYSVGNRHRPTGFPSTSRKTRNPRYERRSEEMGTTSEDAERLKARSGGRNRIWIVVAVLAVAAGLIAGAALAGWVLPHPQTKLLGAGANV